MNWIPTAIPCSSSAGDAATGSRRCILKKMDSASTINAWIMGGSSGHGILQKSGTLPVRNTAGSWKGCRSTSQRRSGLPGGRISELCAKGRKFFFLLQGWENTADDLSTEPRNCPGNRGITVPAFYGSPPVCGKHHVLPGQMPAKTIRFPHFPFVKMTEARWNRIRFSAGFPV